MFHNNDGGTCDARFLLLCRRGNDTTYVAASEGGTVKDETVRHWAVQ